MIMRCIIPLLLLMTYSQTVDGKDFDSTRPNIVIIYADDLGYGDVQCYNPERGKIPTPNIDHLAKAGMRFTDAHSSSGVCSPSRYTLLTGRYHWRSRLQAGIVGLWGAPLIAPNRMTVGTLAQQAGYQTACFGKWHLGWDWPIPSDESELFKQRPNGNAIATDAHRKVWRSVFSQPISGGPIDRGFDFYFGVDVPNWPPYCFIEGDRTIGIPSEYLSAKRLGNNQASNQGPALPNWTLEPTLPALGDRTSAFIKESSNSSKPFLIYMPLTTPHTPLAVNEPWKGKSGLNLYADLVMETDAIVGQVLNAIETSGIADQTMVLFTSDNGCAPYIGVRDLEEQGHFPSGELRGYKSDAWEGGHRVPLIVHWPGIVEPSTTCDALVHQADFVATLADLTEIELPPNAAEDSFSMMPLLRGGQQPIRETSVSCSMRGVPSIRYHNWKYIAAPGSGGWGTGGDQSQPVQLYDLKSDLSESNNLAAAKPIQLSKMQDLLETVITKGRSSTGPNQANDIKVKRYPTRIAK